MNPLDKFIGWFSPRSAYERERYRLASKIMEDQARAYDAASVGRRNKNWHRPSTSANTEVGVALTRLRNGSRDIVRNNPYARRGIKAISTNTIGSGIRPVPDATKDREKRIKKAWKAWAESTDCDFDGLHTFYGLQKLIMRTVAESGECIVRRRRNSKLAIPFQLQVVEPDIIDTNKTSFRTAGEGWVMHGIEFDRNGRRVAYWLFDAHPGDPDGYVAVSRRVPIEDICHIYYVERPGQIRGVPFTVASMMRLKDFDEYEDAELIRQKVAACFSVFVQKDAEKIGAIANSSEEQDRAAKVEPGMIEYLAHGETVSFAAPQGAPNYDPYAKRVLQAISAGMDVTYEVLTGDLSNVNFSSGRMGWIEFHRSVQDWQNDMMIPMFCNKAWLWFMDGLILRGTLNSPVTASWTAPRREMIDPSKEIKAQKEAIRAGTTSWSEVARENGWEPAELMAEIQKDFELMKELGIILESDPRNNLVRENTNPDAGTEGQNSGNQE